MNRTQLATVWLSGCSGCHMSLLNLHGDLLDLLDQVELVYSPLMDANEYPSQVDVVLVEGAVGNRENRAMAELVRVRSRTVISLGDCACFGNISSLRNPAGLETSLETAYGRYTPPPGLTVLERQVLPLHQVIAVDAYIPGCPPEPQIIQENLLQLISRR